MWDFLVLGLIPGTDIQISFGFWLLILTLSAVVFGLKRNGLRKLRFGGNRLPPTIGTEAH